MAVNRAGTLLWLFRQYIAMPYIALARQAWIYRNISDSLGTLLWIKNKLWRSGGGAYLPSENSIVLDPKGTCHSWLWISHHSQAGLASTRGDSACQGRVSWCRCSWRIILKSDQLLVAPIVFSLAVLDNRWRYIFTCTRVDKPASLLIRMLLGFVLTMYLSILSISLQVHTN